jgi:hypothetical protein
LFQATWDWLNTEPGGKPDQVEPSNESMARLDSFSSSRKDPLIFHANDLETPVHFFGSRGEMSGELRDHVQVLAFRPADQLHDEDDVRVPHVSLDADADLTSKLQGNRLYAKSSWLIGRAEQLTRFQLHEKGARVRVEASIECIPFGEVEGPRIVHRRFIYGRPFFVFLWRDHAEWPYFGAWIGDASALDPAGS